MTQPQSGNAPQTWLGGSPGACHLISARDEFDGGGSWIGQHAADQDTLVFDPAESDPSADRISLYSLTQHRRRTFPRSVVHRRAHRLTGPVAWSRARRDCEDRIGRRQHHLPEPAAAKRRVSGTGKGPRGGLEPAE